MRRQIVIAGDGLARQKVVRGFEELDSNCRVLMVEKEVEPGFVFLPHADLHVLGNFQQRDEIAHLAQPHDEVLVERLMAHGPDVDRRPQSEAVHRHGRATAVKVLRIGREDLAILRFNQVTPEPGWMEMAGGEGAFEVQMIVFARRNRIELHDFHTEQIGQVVQ